VIRPVAPVRVSQSLLCLSIALGLIGCGREPGEARTSTNSPGSRSRDLSTQVGQIEARERAIDETTWAKEMLAEEAGRTIEDLWDSLNASTNKLAILQSFPLEQARLGDWSRTQSLPHRIELRESTGPGRVLTRDEWCAWLAEFVRAGWGVENTEFRQYQIDFTRNGRPEQSRFRFRANLTNLIKPARASVEGELVVFWGERKGGELTPVREVDLTGLRIKTRVGKPPFQLILSETMAPLRNARSVDPLIVYDLDGDGLSEIILAGKNLVYHRTQEGSYTARPLCRQTPGVIYTALLADFDGDGVADFLCATYQGLVLYKGSPGGTFDSPGRLVWPAPRDLKAPMVMTCGDLDQHGALDVFIGQYKQPYAGGQMPTPYFDANDGFPAYLLRNDGQGNFTDATEASGLGPKRWRRTYSACFADLDNDGHLDLAVVSDFAGLDLYRNDGKGHFTDVTRQWTDEPHGFGMALALADFNADGRLDLLVMGMPSPTVERLEHLQLWRQDALEDHRMRGRMSFGNRLYLARAAGGFEQTPLGGSLSRSGWSWGCTASDFDNDGYPDVYVANGMESRQSVREYEGEFWLHDAYVATSREDPAVDAYLRGKIARLRSHGASYGGYEKNRLFLNQGGTSFLEAGHLFGVALEPDSRNVVSDDLDGDGRMDLIVTSFEPWPRPEVTLRVYRNTVEEIGNWIGFRFREEGASPMGTQVAIHFENHRAVRQIVTGDSNRSQHANTIHFGLGTAARVDAVEVRWPNGERLTLPNPAINQYHDVRSRPGAANP
jgi:hypothetical protein